MSFIVSVTRAADFLCVGSLCGCMAQAVCYLRESGHYGVSRLRKGDLFAKTNKK